MHAKHTAHTPGAQTRNAPNAPHEESTIIVARLEPPVPRANPVAPVAMPVNAPAAAKSQPAAAPPRPRIAPIVATPINVDVALVPTGMSTESERAAASQMPAITPTVPAPARADGLRAFMHGCVILGVLGALFAGFAVVVVLVLNGYVQSKASTQAAQDRDVVNGKARNLKGSDELAFKLLLAKNTWTPDKELKSHLGALGAWVNKHDDVWLAIAVKDFGMQRPREAEMLQSGVDRLEQRFGENLELAPKAEPVELAGIAGQKLTFKGQRGAVVSMGECIMLSHHGFAYWIFLGGPKTEDVEPVIAELTRAETGLSLVTDRKGWREQPPKTESFASSDGALQVTAPEGVWEKSVPPNVEFETGTLLLLGRYRKEKDNQKNAHLQVFTLDRQADLKEAMKQARDYVEKQRKEQNTSYKLEPVAEAGQAELGIVEDVGNRRGRVAEMMLSLNDTPARYYMVAVISEPERVTVLLCDCVWKSRQIWRQEFLGLFKTVEARAKAS
jgi:hypothetical protein